MNSNPILLKIKDWLELQMGETPFLNRCIGLSVLIFTFCYGASLVLPVIPWERLLP